jgi:hypothetical protein
MSLASGNTTVASSWIRPRPAPALADIAATAAKLLLDHTWNGVGSAPVLGPEDLSYNDMARIMSEVLGKPIRFQQSSGESLKARMTDLGMSEAMVQGYADMWTAYSEGLDTAEPRTPESTTPTSFRQWCEEVLKPRGQSLEPAAKKANAKLEVSDKSCQRLCMGNLASFSYIISP